MTPGLRAVWKDYKLLLTGFALAVAVMLYFGVRTVMFWVYWADPAHRDHGTIAGVRDEDLPVLGRGSGGVDQLEVPPGTG